MDNDNKITYIKTVADIDNDNLITLHLDIAKRAILNRLYPYNPEKETMPAKYDLLQCEIAIYLLNKRGAEGQLTHAENGISRSYESGYIPKSLLNQVIPYAGLPKWDV